MIRVKASLFTIMVNGLLIVVSAPSGAGKTTLVHGLMEQVPNVRYSISATTRSPRVGERNGEDYRFISESQFQKMRESGEMLEFAFVHGHWYGTPRSWVEENLKEGLDVLLDIDVQGGQSIRNLYPESISVFIAPTSLSVLEKRLRARGKDDEKTIQKRLQNAIHEIEESSLYDYLIINDTVEKSVQELKSILISERLRLSRNRFAIESLLRSKSEERKYG